VQVDSTKHTSGNTHTFTHARFGRLGKPLLKHFYHAPFWNQIASKCVPIHITVQCTHTRRSSTKQVVLKSPLPPSYASAGCLVAQRVAASQTDSLPWLLPLLFITITNLEHEEDRHGRPHARQGEGTSLDNTSQSHWRISA